jgi:hypothetical protein
MPNDKVCVICGEYKRRSRKVSFFSIPKLDKNVHSKRYREIVRRRITAWMAVIGSNIYKYYGTAHMHEIIVNSSSLSDNSTLHDNVLHGRNEWKVTKK